MRIDIGEWCIRSVTAADAFRLTSEGLDQMLRPVISLGESRIPSSWALSWQILHMPAGDVIAHGGDNPGFHAWAGASRTRGTGVVVMTNGDSGPAVIEQLIFGGTVEQILAG